MRILFKRGQERKMKKVLLTGLTGAFLVVLFSFCAQSFAENSQDYYNEGVEYLKQGQNQNAVDSLQKAVELDPNYAEAYSALGAAYRAMDKYNEAIDACKKAINIVPDVADPYVTMGSAYYMLGKTQEAINACKKAIKLNPQMPEAYLGLANIYLASQDYQQARNNALKAKDLFEQKGIQEGVREAEDLLRNIP